MSVESGPALTPAEIEDALDHDRLRVIYQPCYDIRTGAMVAVEALARVADPITGDLVAPGRFLPVAEESGLVARLDEAVLVASARRVAQWRALPGGASLCLAINLSVLGLDDASLPQRFLAIVRDAGLPADALIVELTETVLSRAGRGHETVAAELSAVGFNVSLDDFGTGNASFEYLQRFAVHGIKIDRSFVQDLGSGAEGERLAESLVRFCLSLGVLVVGEGVEEPHQLEALRRLGCPFVQGYLLDPPLPGDEVEQRLRDERTPRALGLDRDEAAAPTAPATVRDAASEAGRWGTRSLALLLALVLIGILGYALVSADLAEEHAARDAQERLESVDALAAARIDSELRAIRGVVSSASRSVPVRRALASGGGGDTVDVLETLASFTTDIYTTALYDADGTILGVHPSGQDLIGQNFAHRDYFEGALGTLRSYVSEAFQQRTPGRPWAVAVSAAVRDATGETLGVVIATVRLDSLQGLLQTLEIQHGVSYTLVDDQNVVLASTDAATGSSTNDPRLVQSPGVAAQGASDAEELWATRPVASVRGSLLAQQPRSAAVGPVANAARVQLIVAAALVIAGLGVLALWLHADRRRRRLGGQVQVAYQRLIGLVSATTAPIVMCDEDGEIVLANPAFAALVEAPPDLLPGQSLASWIPGLGDAGPGESGASTVVTTVGDVRTVEISTQTLHDGAQALRLHTLTDVTPHRIEHERLRAQGRLDPLTGVGNRVALRETLRSVVRSETAAYAVVMLDLDGFKRVNDQRGHATGDALLCSVADVLTAATGPNDLVTRVGGDEFVVVLRLDDARQGGELADGLRDRVRSVIADEPWIEEIPVGVSVGMAVVRVDGDDPDALLAVADRRMYQAKGRPSR